jgi:hypothetical protein
LYESTNNLHPFDDISMKQVQNNGFTQNVELADLNSGKMQVVLDDTYLENYKEDIKLR